MTPLRAYTLCTGAAVVLAAMASSIASEETLQALIVVPAIAVGWWLSSRPGARVLLPRWAVNALLLGAIALAVVRGMGRAEIGVVASLVVMLAAIKTLDRRAPRDDAQILALTVFLGIAAMLDSNDFTVGSLLLLLLPALTLAVMLFQLHPRWWPALTEPRAAARPGGGLVRSVAFAGGSALAGTLAVAVGVFVLMPRGIGEGQFGEVGRGRGQSVTGFTNQVSLGRRNVISTSPEVVLDLQLREHRPGQAGPGEIVGAEGVVQYLRGAVLDVYDQGVWRASRRRSWNEIQNLEPGLWLTLPGGVGLSRSGLEQVVSLRRPPRADGNIPLFAAWRPAAVSVERRGSVFVDVSTGSLAFRPVYSAYELSYRVVSAASDAEDQQRSERPVTFASRVVREIAEQALRRAELDPETAASSPEAAAAAARAVQQWFQTGFTYTLEEEPTPEGFDPLEHFLTSTRRGHCEYFASAMAAMCRSLGVPARVVAGFVAAEFNPATGSYTVRQSNAHAWVEAGLGRWRRYDPTPPAELDRIHRPAPTLAARARQLLDALEYAWNSSVVSFSGIGRPDERRLRGWPGQPTWVERLVRDLRRPPETERGSAARGVLAGALGLGVAVGGTLAVLRLMRWRRGPSAPGLVRSGPAADAYRDVLAALRRAGLAKPPASTPLDHAARLESASPAAASLLRDAAGAYYAERFAGQRPEPRALADLRARRARFARAARS